MHQFGSYYKNRLLSPHHDGIGLLKDEVKVLHSLLVLDLEEGKCGERVKQADPQPILKMCERHRTFEMILMFLPLSPRTARMLSRSEPCRVWPV